MALQNYQLFDGEKFKEWSRRDGLHHEETLFFERHLDEIPKSARILDIGTGCGRFIFNLASYGFCNFSGIDLSERLLDVARNRKKELAVDCDIDFSIQSATALKFCDQSKDVVIACQQIYCFLEGQNERKAALREAYRVLAPGGLILMSVMSWEGRWYNPFIAALIGPLKILKGDWMRLSRQYLCWLKWRSGPNFMILFKRQPYIYWYRKNEIEEEVQAVGFSIVDVASEKMLTESCFQFEFGGMLFIAARKPFDAVPKP